MGSFLSKTNPEKKEQSLVESGKQYLEDELARRMMLQREIQMAVNVAKARDTLHIYGSAYALYFTVFFTAKFGPKRLRIPLPPTAAIPLIVGGLALGNLADMAYGNKFARINKEAEYILTHERARFVPFKQAPFAKFYTAEEKASFYEQGTAVGDIFPNSFYARKFVPKASDSRK